MSNHDAGGSAGMRATAGGAALDVASRVNVDPAAESELRSAASDLAASTLEPGIGRAERLSRAERARSASEDRGWMDALNPYGARSHSQLVDMLAASGHPGYRHEDAAAARERLGRRRAYEQLATRAAGTVRELYAAAPGMADDFPGFADAYPLLALAQPLTEGTGPLPEVPGPWTNLPDAVTDFSSEMPLVDPRVLDVAPGRLLIGRWVFNVSMQAYAWQVAFAREYEALAEHQVRVSLERQMVEGLSAGLMPVSSFSDAESRVGAAWAPGATHVLVNGEHLAQVRRHYAAELAPEDLRPVIVGSFGVPKGTAVVLAVAGVRVEATRPRWVIVESPRALGREIGAYGYARASLRIPGAVQLVKIA